MPNTRELFRNRIRQYLRMSGSQRLKDIYRDIQTRYGSLCDDSVECVCGGIPRGQPEWKHLVRLALWDLKQAGIVVRQNEKWTYVA